MLQSSLLREDIEYIAANSPIIQGMRVEIEAKAFIKGFIKEYVKSFPNGFIEGRNEAIRSYYEETKAKPERIAGYLELEVELVKSILDL